MPERTEAERNMFNIANYKFSTKQAGRDTTMYFHNGIDGGRIKRSASVGGQGGMIIYQRNCRRIFIQFYESLRISGIGEDRIEIDMVAKLEKVYRMLRTGNVDSRNRLLYSLTPRAGWRLFEFFDNRGHGSAGTVILHDPAATRVKILTLMAEDGMVSS